MLDFASPLAALAGLAVVLPLLAIAIVRRRDDRVRSALGLAAPGRRARAGVIAAAAAVFGLLALAAAQPILTVGRDIRARADAEAFVVIDVSRSMLAAPSSSGPTRFARARELALQLRPLLADVPLGVASLTDRPLPHLFPTVNALTYENVVREAVGIERPPPEEPGLYRATSFGSLDSLAKMNFYSPRSTRRLALVLTDGESQAFAAGELQTELAAEGVSLVVVRFWSSDERVWKPDGTIETYRPDEALSGLIALRGIGVQVLPEGDPAAVAAAARALLGTGPRVPVIHEEHPVALAPYLALAASVPLAFLLFRSGGGEHRRLRLSWRPDRRRPMFAFRVSKSERMGELRWSDEGPAGVSRG